MGLPPGGMFSHLELSTSASFLGLLLLVSCPSWTSADVFIISADNHTEKEFIDYEIPETASIPDDGIQGVVQVADPPDACTKIAEPPYALNSSLKWFVLIERYPCSNLYAKVKNAQEAGYQAAIIYNVGLNTAPHGNVVTKNIETELEIPGILIGQDDGRRIKSEYTYRTGYTVVITADTSLNLNNYLLPFAIVIGFCVFIMVLFMIIKWIKDRRRTRRNRLSSRHLKHLSTTKYKTGDKYEVCAVCLEDYCEGEKLRILPCAHAYHTKCIDPWLTNNRRNCPICKRKVAIPGVTLDSDSDSETEQDASETTPLLQSSSRGSSTSQTLPVSRTNGGTFSSSSSGSSSGNREDGLQGSQYRTLHEDCQPGPSSRSSSFQEVTHVRGRNMASRTHPRAQSSSDSDEIDVYHSSSQLLAPDNGHSINREDGDDEDAPPVMIVVTESSKPSKKNSPELVV